MAVKTSSRDTTLAALLPVGGDPLAAPRVVSGTNDAGPATEDGGAVVLPVLGNDTGVVGIVQVNGSSVSPGSVITLVSGVQILVNANGTLSFLVNGAYQQLAAGQTATETFTYVATDGGGSAVAPDGFISAGALTAAKGFTIVGAAAGDLAGYAVAGIGDVNSDGIDDVLIGALQADPGGRSSAGTSYVLYGKTGGYTGIDLAALTTAQGFSIRGFAALDFSGTSVSAAGDVNGDGRADFIVGAPKANGPAGVDVGAAYVIFGQAAGGFAGGIDVSSLNGTNGFVIRGGAATDSLGFSVSAAGDVNGDGRADIIVGARDADPAGHSGAGKSYVLFGHTGPFSASIDVTTLNGTNGFSISGIDADDQSGLSVASAGDLNNDGLADLIVGAAGGDPGARTNAGEAYVLFGHTGGFAASIDLSTLNGTNGFVLNGIDAGDFAGWSVAKAGDLNNDGIDDIAVGALYGDPLGRTNAGEVYILYGRNGGGFGASVNLSSISGTTGFVISGGAASDLTGHTVSSAGDVNADGIDDLLIGALYADPAGGGADAGQSYVLFGRTGGYTSVDLSLLNGLTGFAVGGGTAGGFSGQSVTAAGDLNNDGIDDLIIGSPNADPSGRTDAGASYVLYGAANIARLTNPTTVTVTITGVNDAPVITSGGGGAAATVGRVENGSSVATITAVDIDNGAVITYSIAGGADASRFTINGTTGALSFVAAPDFETPTDANADNAYQVIVQASDGTASDTQAFTVNVTNQNEAPAITSNGGGVAASPSQAENTTAVTTVTASDADAGAMLTYSISGGADAARFTINSLTGVLAFVSAPNFEAPTDSNLDNVYQVVVQVSDGVLTDSQNLSVTITNANEAPVITSGGGGANATASTAEGATVVATVAATDPDGTAPTFAIIGGADSAKFKINATTGLLEFKVAPNFEAPTDVGADNVYDVVVRASDGTLSDTQAIAVTVTNVAEAPVITSNGGGAAATRAIAENLTAVTTNLATDPDGTAPTWSIVGGADAALFLIDPASGALRFANAPDFENPGDANADNAYQVTVQASDGTLTDTQALTVTITNANESPVITSGAGGTTASYDVVEGTTGAILNTAVDPDAGSTLTWAIIGGTDQAFFVINSATGILDFANPPDFATPLDSGANNIYQVQIRVTDGARTDVQTLNIRVTDTNGAPVINSLGGGPNGAYSIFEGTTGPTTVSATDPDGTTPTYSIVGGADAGFFTINTTTGLLQLAAARDFETPADANGDNIYEVIVRAFDGALSDTQTIQLTILNANEAPVITSGGGGPNAGASVAEGATAVTTVTASDPDAGASLTFSIVGGADQGLFTINATTGALAFISGRDFETPSDAGGNGVYDVTVQVSDGTLADTQAIAVTVTNANDAPAITSNGAGGTANISVPENLLGVTTVTSTDQDAGAALTYSIIGGADAALFTINAATGLLNFVSTRNFEAPADVGTNNVYDVVVQVSDGTLTDSQAIAVTVTNTNEPPAITSGGGGTNATASVAENTTAVTTVTAADPDAGASLTFSILGGADAARFTINSTTGVLSFVSAPNFEAPTDIGGNNVYDVTVQVSDGANTDTQDIAVTVTNVNEAPTININGSAPTAVVNVPENPGGPTTLPASDPDAGATLTWSIIGGADAALFTLNSTTGAIAFVTDPNFEAPHDANGDNDYLVTVQLSDGTLTDTQAITFRVFNQNEAPVITSGGGGTNAIGSVAENTTAVTTVTASDPDAGASLTYSLAGGADAALFTINATTGALSFISARNFEAPTDVGGDNIYDVIVRVSDGALVDTQALKITVTDAAEAPVITSEGGGATASLSRPENGTAVTTVTASDPNGATLTYSITGGLDQARFTINSSTGVLSFVAPPNFEAPTDSNTDNSYQVIVQASNGSFTDSQTITVAVTNQNEAPVITSNGGGAVGGYTIAENTLGPNPIVAADPDAGATVTYSIVGGADAARFVINALGVIQLAANPNFEAPADSNGDNVYTVIVQASDGTLTDTQTINLTVTNANEAPVITSNGGGATAARSVVENSTVVTTVTATDPDAGATLSFSIVGGTDSSLFTIDATTGALAFISGRDFEAPSDSNGDNVYNVVVQASDGTNTDTQAVNVTVTNRNDAPVITSNGGGAAATITRAENGPLLVTTVTATDQDAGTTLSYSISGGVDAARFSINTATGALSFVSNPDFEAPADSNGDNKYIVIVRSSDGALTDVQTITVVIADVAEGGASPTITSNGAGPTAAVSIAENTTAVTTVTATDPDTPPGSLSYSIAGGIDGTQFAINATTGVLTFLGPHNFENPSDSGLNNVYDVVVRVFDGTTSDTQAIAVTVTNVNEAPVISSGGGGAAANYSVAENLNPANVGTITAGDPDAGAVLSFTIVGGADQALFTINTTTGLLSFVSPKNFETPVDADLNGVYEVIVRASDGTLFDTQAVSVTVLDVNEGPVIASDGGGPTATVNVLENTDLVTFVTGQDPDASPTLIYSIVGGVDQSLFTIDQTTGALRFVTLPDFENPTDSGNDGVYNVVVEVSDGTLSDTQAIAVTVVDDNERPDITSDGGGPTASVDVVENEPDVTVVTAVDPEGQTITYSIVGGADGALFDIDPASGLLSFAASPDFESPQDFDGDNKYEVLVQASDGARVRQQLIIVRVQDDAGETPGPTLTNLIGVVTTNEADPIKRIDSDVSFSSGVANFNGATLRVSGLNATDIVSVINIGNSVGQVGVTAAGPSFTVSYQGQTIGTGTGGSGGDLVVSFNNLATRQAIEAVVEALGYQSQADDSVPNHTLTITITDPLAQEASASFRLVFNANVLNGTPAADSLAGFRGNDTINGFADNDELDGGVGDDIIHGGTGNDTIDGGQNNDSLFGDEDDDHIDGNEGDDFIYGGDGFDTLNGNEDGDHIYGGIGIDSIDGGDGDDVLFGDAGDDNIITGDGFNLVFGGADNDLVYAGLDVDILHGDDGNDELHGSDGDDQLDGGIGNDTLNGEVGDDSLGGGGGDDFLRGGSEADFLDGGAGIDDLDGGQDDDTLRGGDDDDLLDGGLGDDKVFGEGGDDLIQGGDGDTDVIDGGGDRLEDIDTVVYGNALSEYTLAFGTHNDVFVTGPGGFVDHLFNIEFLQFSDTTVSIGNDVPEISSDGGDDEAFVSIDENQTFVTTVTAVDVDISAVLTFSIGDGADAPLFQIDATTGDLTFSFAPDFELPSDSDGDNVYAVEVIVSDGFGEDRQTIFITINDVAGGIIVPGPKGDGAPMDGPAVLPPPAVEVPTGVEGGWLF
ncbi:MAG: hypothetical protein JWR84_1395 [Caulobacter sp.]|nr:hypothetical protein [Caulobacter sp.]